MATSYSALLGLALPVQGELSGTWGDTVNNYITTYLDSAIAGAQTLSTDADVTLTKTTGTVLGTTSSQYAILLCSGARTAQRTITVPAASKMYAVVNATTGGFAIKIVGAGPTTGVTIPNGMRAFIIWNGSDFNIVSMVDASGITTVPYGGTGVATLTGVAYGNGTSAFTAATGAQISSALGSTAVTNATNATNLTGSGTVSATATGGAGLTPTNATNATNLTGSGTVSATTTGGAGLTPTNATNATNATNTAVTDDSATATSVYPTWVSSTTGNLPQKLTSTKLSFVPSTGVLTATSFSGAGTGLTGTASSLTAGAANSVAWTSITGNPTAAAGSVPGANGIARADASGYTYFSYINSNTSNSENPTVSQVIVTNGTDNFYRKSSIASFTSAVQSNASGSWGISVTGSSASCTGNAATATSATNATNATNLTGSGTISDTATVGATGVKVGYRDVPVLNQAPATAITTADAGKAYYANAAGTFTIPANSSQAFPIGAVLTFINMNASACTIAITTDTLYFAGAGTTGSRTLAQYGMATAIKMTATTWLISGSGLT